MITVQEFRANLRNWKNAPLDLEAKPDSFLVLHDWALDLLSGNRLDMRRLKLWAKHKNSPIDAAAKREGASAAGSVHHDVESISFIVFEATKSRLADFSEKVVLAQNHSKPLRPYIPDIPVQILDLEPVKIN